MEESYIIYTGADLIKWIKNLHLEDAPVRVGCQGYHNVEGFMPSTYIEPVTVDGKRIAFICDECAYEDLEGDLEGGE